MKKTDHSDKGSESIEFLDCEKVVQVAAGKSILELALENKIDLNHSCGGFGTCGTCLIEIEGELPQRNELEQEMAEERGFSEIERLACQTIPIRGVSVRLPTG